MKHKRIVVALLAATGVFITTTAESCTHTSDNNHVIAQPTGPATVIQFPYGFRNVAYKCDGPNMVYSGSAGANDSLPPSIAVVANDPRCK
jgi:hypothetical protein